MKKISLLALTAITLVACGDNKPTPEDFQTIEQEAKNASGETALTILSLGAAGDYIVQLPATDALVAIAKKDKSVTFLSVDNPSQYISDGTCLLNIIPKRTMENMNMPENTCNFRLFCGNADDMNAEVYAVEVCSE